MKTRYFTFALAVTTAAAVASIGTPAAAQTRLTLDEALRRAVDHAETLEIARAGEARAAADVTRANSQRLPQINFIGSYDRTLASEFSALADAGAGTGTQDFDFSRLPFGQRNVYRLSVAFAQPIYTGGRVAALQSQASQGQRAAAIATTSANAQLSLDVTRAFFDAALADRLLVIAESGYKQAASAADQARQAFEAGRQPEFERLRADVARDNQQPLVIRARSAREIAYLRLRQLLELPEGTDIVVDVELDGGVLAAPAPFAAALAARMTGDQGADRAFVQQAEALVHVREAGIAIAKAERLPSVSLNSNFGKVGYPSSGAFPGASDFRTNWTLGASVQIPIYTGSRLQADERVARADLAEATARLKQAREAADLDAASARQDMAAADAQWQASAGTVQQAQRAYEIADLRYREGVSTQLELNDSRLALQVAQANRAQAARDLQVARARVALLPELPVR